MIVFGGEAVVDLVPAGDGMLAPRFGGGLYNAALAAARLGEPTALVSRLSTDVFGTAQLERLRASGVRLDLVQRGAEPSTLAVVALDGEGHARYSFYTEGTANHLVADPGELPEEVTALAVGGLGMVLEPGASAYESMLVRAADRGALTVLDPNIRAVLVDDPDAYRARFATWLPHVRVLKLSVEDAAWLTSEPPCRWLDDGVRAVVLTDGANGLTVHTPRIGELHVPAAPAEVVDTIGAGDTVLGSLLAWLYRNAVADPGTLPGGQWADALAYVARAAAVTVSRSGGEPPTADEVGE